MWARRSCSIGTIQKNTSMREEDKMKMDLIDWVCERKLTIKIENYI